MVVTKYSLIGAVLQAYPSAEKCFNEMGMHCVSCHMSPRETLEQACRVHSCDVDELIRKLFDEYGRRLDMQQYYLVGFTIRSYLSWLKSKGSIQTLFEDNMLCWRSWHA